MKVDPKTLFSDLALNGPPLFFPDADREITFNFDQGLAAEETFPLDTLRSLAGEILERDGGRALEYITFGFDAATDQILYLPTYIELVLGSTELREQVQSWIGERNSRSDLTPDSIILTSGSVQAIAMAMTAFLSPGDGALVEAATFPYAMRFMEMRGAEIRPVAIDQDGIDVDDLERQILALQADGIRPKLLYVIPTFQLPTCVVTTLERRRRIIELAHRHEMIVLEDSVYAELRYDGEPVPSLLSMDDTGLVIQSHGFSKIVAPALRLGWMTGAPEMIAGMAAVRQDLGVSQWMCRLMAEFMRSAVREHCAPYVDFDLPSGGFFLWLRMSDEVDWARARSAAEAAGVLCRPGEVFMGRDTGQRYLRLAYSHVADHEIERGIRALGAAIHGAARP
jgi:2-aminoadipate transaminase